jgi:hypothetical protein
VQDALAVCIDPLAVWAGQPSREHRTVAAADWGGIPLLQRRRARGYSSSSSQLRGVVSNAGGVASVSFYRHELENETRARRLMGCEGLSEARQGVPGSPFHRPVCACCREGANVCLSAASGGSVQGPILCAD